MDIAEIVAEFERTIAEAVRVAYLALSDAGVPDEQIDALLGLPAEAQIEAHSQADQAA